MAKYLYQASYTDAGLQGLLKEGGSSRRAAVEKAVVGVGGTLEAFYYAFGHTDVFCIVDLPGNVVTPQTPLQDVDHVSLVPVRPRQIMPLAESMQVDQGVVELEKGFSSTLAQTESERCLQCGLICYLRDTETEAEPAAAES